MKTFRLLTAQEIECRVARAKATGCALLLYKDARCDMSILDETVGATNWQKSYSRENRNCTVSIWDAEKAQWISKEDTGTESNTEAEKGLASDSFKRACFCWGIGRELYTAPFIWINNTACNITGANGKYQCLDKFIVSEIGYDDRENINRLVIVNETTKETCYTFGRQQAKKTEQIGKTKANALLKCLEAREIAPIFVCELYKVKTLEELTERQHSNIINNLSEIKAAYGK